MSMQIENTLKKDPNLFLYYYLQESEKIKGLGFANLLNK